MRTMRNQIARALAEGFDPSWERYRFSLLSADMALDAVPDGRAKIGGRWVQVTDAPGWEVRGPLGKVDIATVLVAIEPRRGSMSTSGESRSGSREGGDIDGRG